MGLIFQSKCIVLIFLHLANNAKSTESDTGTSNENNMRNQKINNGQEYTALYWPKGIVSYYLDNRAYDNFIAQRIRMSMNVLESASCVRFKSVLLKPAENMIWINFTNPQGERKCVHEPIFKDDGEIVVVFGFDCLKSNEILHTLLHAIGFKDEVSHPQRDQYIRVMWNNIQPEYQHLYRIRPVDQEAPQPLVEYDPQSIMHFHDRAFSVNGGATIMPLVPGLRINPSDDLSQLDKLRLRLLFDRECNKRKVGDLIDTCKKLVSNDAEPNDSKYDIDSNAEGYNDGSDEGDIKENVDDNSSNTLNELDEANEEEVEDDELGSSNNDGKDIIDDEDNNDDELGVASKENEDGIVSLDDGEGKDDEDGIVSLDDGDGKDDEDDKILKSNKLSKGEIAEETGDLSENIETGKFDLEEVSNKIKIEQNPDNTNLINRLLPNKVLHFNGKKNENVDHNSVQDDVDVRKYEKTRRFNESWTGINDKNKE